MCCNNRLLANDLLIQKKGLVMLPLVRLGWYLIIEINLSFSTFRKLKISLMSRKSENITLLVWGILGEKFQLNVFIKIIHLVLQDIQKVECFVLFKFFWKEQLILDKSKYF